MTKLQAAITAVHGWVPEYILDNEELSTMVDTNDEWIITRTGIKERRILKEAGKATAFMASNAVKGLIEKAEISPQEIECLIIATITPDTTFPNTAALVAKEVGATKAFGFDLNAACSGFLFAMETATQFICSGKYKKIVVVGADMMSTITDYTNRNTCILFGDGAAAVLLEPNTDGYGVIDSDLHIDGIGAPYLYLKGGGSLHPATEETVKNGDHYIFQDGKTVFKYAVNGMANSAVSVCERNSLKGEDIRFLIPHQANKRIIDATAHAINIDPEKVTLNIQKYGNTTAATIPLCIWEWEKQMRKGDNIILAAFGAGFTWGSMYLKWAYNSK